VRRGASQRASRWPAERAGRCRRTRTDFAVRRIRELGGYRIPEADDQRLPVGLALGDGIEFFLGVAGEADLDEVAAEALLEGFDE
jgi:hypothetical protein